MGSICFLIICELLQSYGWSFLWQAHKLSTADTIYLSKAPTPTKITDNSSNGSVSFLLQKKWFKTTDDDRIIAIKARILVLISITAISPVNLAKWRQQVSKCSFTTHLFGVFTHVGVNLTERAHAVELVHVHPWLFCQVGVHVLVADRWHLTDVWVVPVWAKKNKKQNSIYVFTAHSTVKNYTQNWRWRVLDFNLGHSRPNARHGGVGNQSLSAAAVPPLSTMLIKVGYLHIIFL